ncbi:endogenous retrovirus group K member 9 Pol protein [Equus przewalskii]|uniref:Endogenous retrovirus group K member 9 Pol protein n=1 Tax=Equus przewalskii TaxID=9798 RepID=A0ABM4PJR5_EQUPR
MFPSIWRLLLVYSSGLKDAFYCIPLSPESQDLFAFEWADPETNVKQHCGWMILPQGFQNAPTIFGEALAKDLRNLQVHSSLDVFYLPGCHLVDTFKQNLKNSAKQLFRLFNNTDVELTVSVLFIE